jgi:two-component system phosphate regulon sensor histidine kinase PhoR
MVEVPQILEQAGREAAPVTREVVLPAESPRTVGATIDLRASPLRDAEGGLSGAVAVLHDVSELRRLESVRRDFVANVSHELKTPLTAIRGFVETLLSDPRLEPATRQRFLERIRDQSERLSLLVADLLTLARIESQQIERELYVLDLRGALREAALRFGPQCQGQGIALELAELPDEPLEVRSDPESIREIVDNLMDNAIKYTPSGGRVRLGARRVGDQVEISVSDTGIGIEPRDQERVFERFYRVDKARSRELGGTGLGLSIVKHLALALEGGVSLESRPGRGSTFFVHLPRAEGGNAEL